MYYLFEKGKNVACDFIIWNEFWKITVLNPPPQEMKKNTMGINDFIAHYK